MLVLSFVAVVVVWIWFFTIFLDGRTTKHTRVEFQTLGKAAKPNIWQRGVK